MYIATLKQQGSKTFLSATNLVLGNRPNPDEHAVQRYHHYANDPEDLRVVRLVVTEDDGKDNTAKVSGCADNTRKHTFRQLAVGP